MMQKYWDELFPNPFCPYLSQAEAAQLGIYFFIL